MQKYQVIDDANSNPLIQQISVSTSVKRKLDVATYNHKKIAR